MAIPVLLILAVLWAAVLVPPVLRSRSESRRGAMDFPSRLGSVTGRRSPRPMGSRAGRSLHAVPAPRVGTVRPQGVTGRGARPVDSASQPIAAGAPAPVTPAQRRRRDVLIILGGAAIATLLLPVVLGNPLLWIVQVLADVMLCAYVVVLVYMRQRGALSALQSDIDSWPQGPPSTRPLPHPRVPPRPELAPLSPAASSLRRSAAR